MWKHRYYYVLKNKTTGKMYVGQTMQDITKYKGSGPYWVNHCKKHGGYTRDNIEVVWKHWFEDEEFAQLFLDEFNDKYPSYYLPENVQWANEIPENTSNQNSPSKQKHIAQKISESRYKITDSGETLIEVMSKKISDTMTTGAWKESIGYDAHRRQSETRLSDEWKQSVGYNAHKKQSETRLSQEWKQTVGTAAKQKELKTKSSEEWKQTVGIQAQISRKDTLNSKRNRPIVHDIKQLQKQFGIKICSGWTQMSDEKLEQIYENIQRIHLGI